MTPYSLSGARNGSPWLSVLLKFRVDQFLGRYNAVEAQVYRLVRCRQLRARHSLTAKNARHIIGRFH